MHLLVEAERGGARVQHVSGENQTGTRERVTTLIRFGGYNYRTVVGRSARKLSVPLTRR